jgi:hypothetical protein
MVDLSETIRPSASLAYPKSAKFDMTPDEKRAVSAPFHVLKTARRVRQ